MVLKSLQKSCFSSSSSHLECNSFGTRLQQSKPGAGSSRRYFFLVWLRKRSERYRSWTSEAKLRKKVLLSLPTTCLLLTVTGDTSNHGKRPRRHNLRPWGTYMTTCYQSMVHVKSYLKFRACKAPLGAAGTKSRLKYSQWTCTTKLDTVASGHLPTPEPAP